MQVQVQAAGVDQRQSQVVGGGMSCACGGAQLFRGEAGTGGPRQILWPGWDAQAQTDLAEAYRVPQAAQCQSTTPSPQLQLNGPNVLKCRWEIQTA
ncbi:hypothetical protein GGP41_001669 [Bipolaris sorokiniana]|uniref:Uncharacterized protein n=1 Tax=Cochliobolus sativus TaxID=45130 RepID=A0A8H5ZPW4_COCSA|nr:hypothetical protein GGP41_001669 [Bipolaris sorokiniana]